jgi:hypothetical protein
MKRKGAREAGECSKMVSDRGDQCLFVFKFGRRLFFDVFSFPFSKAQLKGLSHELGWDFDGING